MGEINTDWRTFTSQGQWERYFKKMLIKNDILLKRAILIIYDLQTEAEQNQNHTKERNGIGFNTIDGTIMGRIAKKLKYKNPLTLEDINQARARMPKYWRQLMEHTKIKHNM